MQDSILKNLSDRALNVLTLNKMDNPYFLIDHYKREGHFLSLRQCGPVVNDQIVEFCEDIMNENYSDDALMDDDLSQNREPKSREENGEDSNETQPVMLDTEKAFLGMSDRARNTLLRNGIVGVGSMIKYYRIHKSFDNLRHCGPVTNDELVECCEEIVNT